MAWRIKDTTVKNFTHDAEVLAREVDDLRNAFDEKSERWRDSDKGQEVSAWLDDLERLLDEMEDIEWEPGE